MSYVSTRIAEITLIDDYKLNEHSYGHNAKMYLSFQEYERK